MTRATTETALARKIGELAANRAELKTLMFYIVAQPITVQTWAARRELVRKECPRWRPDRAFARLVGDPLR